MNDEEIHNHKYFTPLHHEIAGQLGMKQTPNYATWDVVEETAPVQVVDRIVRFIEERDKSRDQQIALAARIDEASKDRRAVSYGGEAHHIVVWSEKSKKYIENYEHIVELTTLKQAQEEESDV